MIVEMLDEVEFILNEIAEILAIIIIFTEDDDDELDDKLLE